MYMNVAPLSYVPFHSPSHCYLKRGSLTELEGSNFSYTGGSSSSY